MAFLFVRFLISGGLATIVHWAVFALLAHVGIVAVLATTLGAITGAIVNYYLQFYVTFKSQQKHIKTLPNYLIAVGFSFFLNGLIFMGLEKILPNELMVVQILTSMVVTVINFILYKKVVFHDC